MKKKPGKKLIRFAWVITLMFIGSFFAQALEIPGNHILTLLPVFLFLFFFLPIYFLSKRKELKECFGNYFVLVIQFFALAVVSVVVFYNKQQYEMNSALPFVLLAALFSYALTLLVAKSVKIKHPIFPVLFTIVCFWSITFLENTFLRRQYMSETRPLLKEIRTENNALQKFLHKELSSTDLELIEYLDELSYTIYFINSKAEPSLRDSASTKNAFIESIQGDADRFIYAGYENSDFSTNILIGSDPVNLKTGSYTAVELKKQLTQFINNQQVSLTPALSRSILFSFEGVQRDEEFLSWEIANFHNVPAGGAILKMEVYKYFVLNHVLHKTADSVKVQFYETAENHRSLAAFSKEVSRASENTMGIKGPFRLLLAIACLMILFIFYLPTFSFQEKWKRRILLFIVVIIFEYILLVADYFVGIFSSGVEMILGVNILLALGLVAVDSFLRNNFLEWYKLPDNSASSNQPSNFEQSENPKQP